MSDPPNTEAPTRGAREEGKLRAFLEEIRDQPEQDAPRLVLADWLEEQGDPRGTLLRVQCWLASEPADHPARPAWEAQERDLLRQHRAGWVGLLIELGAGCLLERGLLQLYGNLRRLVSGRRNRCPLDCFDWLETLSPEPATEKVLKRLADWPPLGQVVHLHLRNQEVPEAGMAALLASPFLGRLQTLDLRSSGLSPELACALARASSLNRLRILDLSYNRIGDTGMQALASAPQLASLRVLKLNQNRISDAGVEALVRSPYLGQLTMLNLYANGFSAEAGVALEKRFGDCVFW
jgi:uncharacterized protein (TIGR02996 family)